MMTCRQLERGESGQDQHACHPLRLHRVRYYLRHGTVCSKLRKIPNNPTARQGPQGRCAARGPRNSS